MITNTNSRKVQYKAFGLRILSEIPLRELPRICSQDFLADVDIELMDLSHLWFIHSVPNERFVINENFVMFRISETAIFCIEEGKRVLVSPMAGADIDRVRLFILGTCIGILLIQRRIYALHGSAVEINGKVYAIVGDSGAGKSTLAAELLARGYKLLSDDVIPITFSQNQPTVVPAYPQQKLWQESLVEFGMDPTYFKPIFGERTKFSIPLSSQFTQEPLPLAGVFELVKIDNCQTDIQPIQNLERMQTLFYHTYRNFIIQKLGLMDWHFSASIKILSQTFMYQLCRPTDSFTAPTLAAFILDTIQMEEERNAKKQTYIVK